LLTGLIMRTTLFAVAVSVIFSLPAAAQQQLKVSFHDGGRVTVEATAATARAILNEWSKNGGTKVMGAEKISGAPLTIKLVNVPEAQALETILRSVAGYMAAPRQVVSGPSVYDRILIMATTSAPPVTANRPAPATNTNNALNGTQRFVPPQRNRAEQPEQEEAAEPDENPPSPPVFTFPQPGQQNGPAQFNQPGMFNPNNPPNGGAQTVIVNPANGATPAPSPVPYQPGMPIGVSTPGMMVPAPQQPQPATPGMIRPPGQKQ
jgi:hypothetical protein